MQLSLNIQSLKLNQRKFPQGVETVQIVAMEVLIRSVENKNLFSVSSSLHSREF